MNRLTPIRPGREMIGCKDRCTREQIQKMFLKLGKLEDIEEELGIDLVYATELCKKVNAQKLVYTKENWGIGTLKFFNDLDIELFSGSLYSNACGVYISLKIKDYGKYWSLTREELENDK